MTDAVDAAGVLPLYPQPGPERPLRGLYLDHGLPTAGRLIYANFISSLDGRVALPDEHGVFGVPAAIANSRDWWLFQELAVQADAMLVSGRYLRARARGEVQDLFAAFHDSRYEELRRWREAQDLPAWPRVVVLTRAVDFEPPPDIDASRLLVLSGAAGAASAGARRLRSAGAEVAAAGAEDGIDAHRLRGVLSEAGCARVYAVGGPRVLHLLAAGAALDRLYLTLAPRLLGGERLSTLVEGDVLDPVPALKLRSLYYDQVAHGAGAGQLLACYAAADEGDAGD